MNGAKLILTNSNSGYRAGCGLLIPDAGALSSAITFCTKTKIDADLGKPSTFALEVMRAEISNFNNENCIFIGDDIRTDILFANNCGMASVLTMTGKTNREALEKSEIKPKFIVNDLTDLLRSVKNSK